MSMSDFSAYKIVGKAVNNSDANENWKKQLLVEPTRSVLLLEYRTWARDSHELFDYESSQFQRGNHFITCSSRIFRDKMDVKPINADEASIPPKADYLLSIKSRNGKYYVFPADRNVPLSSEVQPRKMWLITKYLKNSSYALGEGDIIKLGRFKLRVKKIIVDDRNCDPKTDYSVLDTSFKYPLSLNGYGKNSVDSNNSYPKIPCVEDLTLEERTTAQCRFCLTEGSEDSNPLLKACECKGSIMFIHLECLKHWVLGKLNFSEDSTKNCLFIKPVICELCKVEFPSCIYSNGVKIPVIQLPQLEPPYIVLENLAGPNSRGIHLCSLALTNEFRLGRGHESDVRMTDVSISRWHATVKFRDGRFYIEDHASKFGTLVALRKPVLVDSNCGLSVQVGRSVMKLTVTDSLSFFNMVVEPKEEIIYTNGLEKNSLIRSDISLNNRIPTILSPESNLIYASNNNNTQFMISDSGRRAGFRTCDDSENRLS